MVMRGLYRLLFVLFVCVFVGHAVKEIDELRLHIFRSVVFSRDEIWQGDGMWLQYITTRLVNVGVGVSLGR